MITEFYMPLKVIIGEGSINRLGEEAKDIGNRALIVTYPDIRKVGMLDKIIAELNKNGVVTLIFEEVEPNPRSTTIDKGAEIARKEKVDLVIGLGGGSAMDSAKGIATASTGIAPIWDYVMRKAQVSAPAPAIIQIPTLAGTGSELNQVAVITNWQTHDKNVFFSPAALARVSIVDPALTISVPRRQTASGGADTFSHLVEYYLMPDFRLPLNDAFREAVMRTVVEFLPKALVKPDDIEARTQLSWASTIAMSNLARLGGTVGSMTCHNIEHAVSAYYDITHGEGLAALLPAWMRHIEPVRKQRLDMLGKNVFGKSDGIKATEEWFKEVGVNFKLTDLGCEKERADEIAEITLRSEAMLAAHPRPLDKAAVAQIYRDSC
jgi:alcohol dehydrogenase YqhD (iron-dependent ADH family)